VIVIDWKLSKITHKFKGHRAIVFGVRFHPDENQLLATSSSQDGSVKMWDIVMNTEVLSFQATTHAIQDYHMSNDGKFIIAAYDEKLGFYSVEKKTK
jgi:WD40 repeat protein